MSPCGHWQSVTSSSFLGFTWSSV